MRCFDVDALELTSLEAVAIAASSIELEGDQVGPDGRVIAEIQPGTACAAVYVHSHDRAYLWFGEALRKTPVKMVGSETRLKKDDGRLVAAP